jgi:hypothetical protein
MNRQSAQNPYSHPLAKPYPLPAEHRAALDALIVAIIEMDEMYPPPWWVSRFELPTRRAA